MDYHVDVKLLYLSTLHCDSHRIEIQLTCWLGGYDAYRESNCKHISETGRVYLLHLYGLMIQTEVTYEVKDEAHICTSRNSQLRQHDKEVGKGLKTN